MSLAVRFGRRSLALYRIAVIGTPFRCSAYGHQCRRSKSTTAATDRQKGKPAMKIGEVETSERKGIKEEEKDMTLEALGIDKEIARALRELHGVCHATPMQAMLLRELLHNQPTRHVVVRYETGAGKTLMTLAAVLSQALGDYHQLLNGPHHYKRSAIFEALAVNTIIVAPNRELAMQTEHWAHRLLLCAYPHLSAIKFVQRFVVLSTSKENEPSAEGSGGDTSRRELRVLARHGPPIIAVGTHRRLLEMLCDPANPLVVRPPALMRFMYEKIWNNGGGEQQQSGSSILQQVQERKGQLLAQEDRTELADYVGLRRLVVDEVDAALAVDSAHPRRMAKRRHAPKPRAGQVLVKSILEVCGSTVLLSRVLDTHSTEISYGSTVGANVYARTLATSIGADEARDLSTATTAESATDARRLSVIFAGVSKAITWTLSTHEDDNYNSSSSSNSLIETLPNASDADAEKCDVRMSDAALATVSPFSLQVVAVAATPTRRVRTWLRNNGCVPGDTAWLAPEDGSYSTTPHTIQHHCIIIENESLVRNLQLKDSNSSSSSSSSSAELYENVKQSEENNKSFLPLVNLTAEVAANVIEHFNPANKEEGGPVLIFTHPSADKTGLAKALRAYGIHARDILHHFGTEQQQQQLKKKKESPGSSVYLVSEPAARGLDMPDASLVLILDTPSSATSYLHMAGRTGRFGRSGHAVTVMPMGMHGFYESKMRGIYAVLDIAPMPISIVE